MSNETFGSPAESQRTPDEKELREHLIWRTNEARKAAKDLLLNVDALPFGFPKRDNVLKLIKEILDLVPVLDPGAEAQDEREREELDQSLMRMREGWHRRNG